jgi:hypothetical protein
MTPGRDNGWTYRCPRCNGVVNPAGIVHLLGLRGGAQMLIGFHPEPGNYELFAPPEAAFERGDLWSFHCPICQSDLATERQGNLCELQLFTGDGHRRRVLFSRVAGEHATYVERDDGPETILGEHANRYDVTMDIAVP